MSGVPVLAVERDRATLHFLRSALAPLGVELLAMRETTDVLVRAYAWSPRLVLVGLGLETLALPLVRRLRADLVTTRIPVLLLARAGQEGEVAAGLEQGASGFLALPAAEDEAASQVEDALRWDPCAGRERVLTAGPISIDVEKRAVLRPVMESLLTPCEFELLRWLLTPAGRSYTRRQLLAADRAAIPPDAGERVVDVHVASLRRKLGAAGEWIETLRGIGYRLCDPRKKCAISRNSP